jgi:ectoine hydroxylase-related dioxygenase (phytanoyl-CoA dioxygenase family)
MIPLFNHTQAAEALEYFKQQGFVAINSTINKEELDKLRETMLHLIEVEKELINKTDYKDYGFLLCAPYYADKHPEILTLLENTEMLDFVESILDKWFTLYLYTNNCIPPNNGITKAVRIHVDTPRIIPNYDYLLATIILLDDFTEENGATWILPNSHLETEQPNEEYFYKNSVQFIAPKGSILYFNPRIWHAAGTNNSDNWRSCLIVAYCKPWVKQRVDIPRFMSHINTKEIPERTLQLLGFRAQTPGNFNEFYGDKEERTYTQPFV